MRKIYFFKLVIPAQVLDKIKTLLFPQWGNSLGPECFFVGLRDAYTSFTTGGEADRFSEFNFVLCRIIISHVTKVHVCGMTY